MNDVAEVVSNEDGYGVLFDIHSKLVHVCNTKGVGVNLREIIETSLETPRERISLASKEEVAGCCYLETIEHVMFGGKAGRPGWDGDVLNMHPTDGLIVTRSDGEESVFIPTTNTLNARDWVLHE